MMNKKIITISLLTLFLAGCGGEMNVKPLPQQEIFRNQLVIVSVPEEFFKIPNNIPPLNTETMTQRDVASWVIQNEKRTNELENKLIELRDLFARTYELVKNSTNNVIIIDTTKSDEFNKKTIEEANKKPIIIDVPQEKIENNKDKGFLSNIKNMFSTPVEETKIPVEIKPEN